MKSMLNARGLVILLVVALVAAFFVFDLGQYLTLDYLKSQREAFLAFYAENRLMTLTAYFVMYTR